MYKLTTGCSERLWSSMLRNIENTTRCSPKQAAVAGLALRRGLDKAISRGASQPQPCCEPVTLRTVNSVCLGLTCCSMSDWASKEKKVTKIGPLFLTTMARFLYCTTLLHHQAAIRIVVCLGPAGAPHTVAMSCGVSPNRQDWGSLRHHQLWHGLLFVCLFSCRMVVIWS